MKSDKHTSRTKHFNNSNDYAHTTQPTKKKKTLLILVVISIIAIVIFLGYLYFSNYPISLFSNNNANMANHEIETYEKYIEKLGEASAKVKTSQSVTVKGAEHLEITGLHINSDNPKLSTVSAKLKNLLDSPCYNVDIRITLFDKNNKQITFLDYKINMIEPHGETSTYAALKCDLSNCKNYTIALKKPN